MANARGKVTLPRLTFKNGKTIKHGDIVIPIPDGYHYTTDSSEMYEGKSYPILIVPADYSFSDNPDDAPFSIAFEPYMTMSKDGKGIDIGPETAVGMERFLCMQWGQVFNSDVTWIDAGVRNGFGAFYQLYGDESTPSHRFMLGMIVTRYQMGAVHIHCNQKNADLWNDPYGFIDKCNSFLEKVLVSGEVAPSYVSTTPFDILYPHYSQLKGKSGSIAPGVTMITNATGTEYEFIPLSRAIDNDELPEDERAAYQRVIEKDTATYDLADRVPEMQRLFHVNASVFNQKRDRECEIDQGLLHRAYMMSALRSFAWTLAEYCESKSTKPDNVPVSKLKEIVAFCAEKEWLNYRGDSYCNGLCGCSDLHVFYIPDVVSNADRKKLLPSDELIKETERRKAALPYYNPILDEVHSLDALRKDLAYIYLAIHALFDSLAQNRNYDEALTGNEADIVYAWCSLAKAAKEPFYVEDGPMHCYFTQMKTEEESAAEREAQRIQWEAEREEIARQNEEEWLKQHVDAVEKNPDIQFDGKLFVFSGVDSDEVVDAVLKRGGQQRSKISSITNYLIVDPRHCGESKTNNAIEQQKKGKPVKIILLDDLKAALEGKTPAAKPVSEPLSRTKKTTASAADAPRKTIISELSNEEDTTEDKYVIFEGELLEYKGSETEIVLPDGITKIGACLFQSSALRSIVIPDSVKEIGGYAFNIVNYLCKTFHITESQFQIRQFGATKMDSPDARFALLKNPYDELTIFNFKGPGGSVEIPESIDGYPVTSIFSYAFSTEPSPRWTGGGGCNEPPLSYRKNSQFSEHYEDDQYNCMQIEELLIPNSIREIGERAFYGGLPKIKHLSIPEAVASIPDIWSFKSLQRLDLPEQAFRFTGILFQIYDCPELQYIELPKGISETCSVRIESCKKLAYIEMPDHLPQIHGIRNCPALRELYLPIDRFEQLGFEGCTSLTDVYFPNLKYAFKNGFNPEQIAHLTIHGYPKSYAEKYAKRIGANFVPDCSPEKKKELDEKYRQLYGNIRWTIRSKSFSPSIRPRMRFWTKKIFRNRS